MPASYAHYRFGKLLLPNLPSDVRQTIQRFRRMYDLGLQGPDFFFYYKSEFERFLLARDGEASPQTFDMRKHLRLTRGECMTVADFYPGTTGGKVFRSVRSMAFLTGILVHPGNGPFLRKYIPSLWEHSIPAQENPELAPYISELHDLYGQALERYPELLSQLTAYLQSGTDLGEDFAPDFG